ncbi:MAG: preprotein translocase subunit YajC [Propionibacteriaceae bacterium]|nr:preprotein translocase subunit YajC [Propionibacteriaceae bacterium]
MSFELIIILVIMGVVMYLLMIRPARKQQQKQQQMMNALEVGSRVMLGSGIYGTIRHLGEKQAVIEISPGVDLTVIRAAIRGPVSEDEEEFEYSTEPDDDRDIHADTMAAFEADLASPNAAEPASHDDQATDPAPETDDQSPEPDPGDEKNNEK